MTVATEVLSVFQAEKQYESKYSNIYDSLAVTAGRFPQKVGLLDSEKSTTYSQFKKDVDILAGALRRHYGVKCGDAAGLLMDNSIDFLRAFYAMAKLGCTVVMLNTKQQPPEWLRYLDETGVRLLLAQAKWRDKVADCAGKGSLREVLYDVAEDGLCIEAILSTESPDETPAERNPAAAAVMFTSGSTGLPKGAVIEHENIMQTAYGYEEELGLGPDDVTVLCVPVFHILGLSCVSTLFVYLGATLILEPAFKEEQVLEKLARHGATHFHSAPTVFIRLAKALEKSGNMRLDGLRVCICGGAVIADAGRETFCKYAENASFRIAYGMTETAGGGMLSRAHRGRAAPCRNVSAKIVDGNMRAVPMGETGQILVRGGVVIAGYLGGRDGGSFHDGWLRTGDLAKMFPDGGIVFQGRLKELINRGGEKVFPADVERVLLSFPGVAQAAVFGLPDAVYGEVPAAAVVLRDGVFMTPDELRALMIPHLAKYEIPVKIELRDDFPYTASGKVAKHILAEALQKHTQG